MAKNIGTFALTAALPGATLLAAAQSAPGPLDRYEVEGVAKQDKSGLLMTPAVNGSFEALKQSIKGK